MSGTVNSVRHYNSGCLRYTVSLMFKEAPDCQKKTKTTGTICAQRISLQDGSGDSIREGIFYFRIG